MATLAPMAGAKSPALLAFSMDCDHGAGAFAQRLGIEPARQRRQQPDIGESGEAAADIRIVVERGDAEGFAQRAKAVGFALSSRAR